MATENRRQTLLREMGIQCWFPRATLPGAGPSHDIGPVLEANVQPQPVGSASPMVSAPARKARPEPGDQRPTALRAVLISGSDVVPEPGKPATMPDAGLAAAGPIAAGSDEAEEPVQEFAFSWFNVDKRLAVLAMLPAGADRLSSTCEQMLTRILAALNPEFNELGGKEHTFHWPFPGDLGLPTGRLAARQAVDGFVARRLRELPSSMLLILADDRPPFLYDDTAVGGADHNGKLVVHRHFGFAMLRTHSLHAMDANSELKRSAWQAMQPLRDRLCRGDQ